MELKQSKSPAHIDIGTFTLNFAAACPTRFWELRAQSLVKPGEHTRHSSVLLAFCR